MAWITSFQCTCFAAGWLLGADGGPRQEGGTPSKWLQLGRTKAGKDFSLLHHIVPNVAFNSAGQGRGREAKFKLNQTSTHGDIAVISGGFVAGHWHLDEMVNLHGVKVQESEAASRLKVGHHARALLRRFQRHSTSGCGGIVQGRLGSMKS